MSDDSQKSPQKKILIVEDDEPTRRLIATIMLREGYVAVIAASGDSAMKMVETSPFDAVILDLMMPLVDGRMVIDFLSELPSAPPVVVCTAAGPAATSAITSPLVKAVIRKPFEIDDMREIIASVLAGGTC